MGESKLEIRLSRSKNLSFNEIFDHCGPMMGVDDLVTLSKHEFSLALQDCGSYEVMRILQLWLATQTKWQVRGLLWVNCDKGCSRWTPLNAQ